MATKRKGINISFSIFKNIADTDKTQFIRIGTLYKYLLTDEVRGCRNVRFMWVF